MTEGANVRIAIERFLENTFDIDPHDDEAFLVDDIMAVLEGKGAPSRNGSNRFTPRAGSVLDPGMDPQEPYISNEPQDPYLRHADGEPFVSYYVAVKMDDALRVLRAENFVLRKYVEQLKARRDELKDQLWKLSG